MPKEKEKDKNEATAWADQPINMQEKKIIDELIKEYKEKEKEEPGKKFERKDYMKTAFDRLAVQNLKWAAFKDNRKEQERRRYFSFRNHLD